MNNRQAGRRRGRGGQRSQGNPNANSRIDSRQRGNANQLYEKYKNLARDAQMSGDRVNTEYYLQFADHYFRVLNENRSRFEENRRQREDAESDEEGEDEMDQRAGREGQRYDREEPRFNGRGNGHAENDADEGDREPRQAFGRGDRPRRTNGLEEKATDQPVRALEGEPGTEAETLPPKRGRGRPRKERPAEEASAPAVAIDADRLPPSISGGDEAAEEKPRRRRGRPPASAAANAPN